MKNYTGLSFPSRRAMRARRSISHIFEGLVYRNMRAFNPFAPHR